MKHPPISIILPFLLFLFTGGVFAQNTTEVTWSRRYGGDKDDGAYSIVAAKDGGFAMAGYTESYGEGGKDGWVLKLSAEGDLLWQYTFGIPQAPASDEVCKKIIETSDGGFMIAGYVEDKASGNKEAWLIRLNKDGRFLWEKRYGGQGEDAAADVIETSTGEFIFAGYTKSFGKGDSDFWILKVDIRGDIVWGRRYGSIGNEEAVGLVQGKNGQIIVAGTTDALGNGSKAAWVIALDNEGRLVWEKTYKKDFNVMPQTIIVNRDGSYTLAGILGGIVRSVSGTKPATFGWSIRLNATGGVVWEKSYGIGGQAFYSITEDVSGNLVMCGTTENEKTSFDYWILKTDKNGKEMWNRSYGGLGNDTATAIAPTPDKGTVLAGITDSFPGKKNIWSIRLNADGLASE